MFTLETVTAGGLNTGAKANAAPVRFVPFTVKLTVGVLTTCIGLAEVMTGICSIVKLLLDVAVELPTVTLSGPVVAPAGTVVVRLFAVAAVTVAAVPLNSTLFELGVVLKFCYWMVTVWPKAPCVGEKPKIASELGETVERVIESRLPTAS